MESGVYDIVPLSGRTYLIRENDTWGVNPNIYLIVGQCRNILIDTGVGSGDLLSFIRDFPLLKNGNILVINTASLPHQTGANHLFSAMGKMGKSHKVEDLCASSFNRHYAESKNSITQWEIKEYKVTRWLDNNEKIDVDEDLSLQVIHTPGPTPDSVVLWFEAENRLFTGNLFYQIQPISLTFNGSDIKQYANSFSKVLDMIQRHSQPSCIRYSAVLYNADEPCQPTFKLFKRFLYMIIAGLVTPGSLSCYDAVAFESTDKLQKLELRKDSFELLRKAQTIAQASKNN